MKKMKEGSELMCRIVTVATVSPLIQPQEFHLLRC